jgi:transforming growth factor-beta-induced protein
MYTIYTGGTEMRTTLAVLAAAVVAAVAVVAPAAAAPTTNGNIAQIASSSPQFSTLASLLKKAGLVGALKSGNYTVFAPTNAAFAKLPKSTLAAVGKDPALLKKVLTYHVVKGKAPASTVVTLNGKSVKTLEGQGVKVSVRGGKVFLNGSTRVTKTDVMASNGVIHVINRVLIPRG